MTDPQQKLEARITQVNEHWKDQRPHELVKRLMLQPLIGEAMCALGDTIIDELTDRRHELVALRVGALRENAYIWRGHCQIAQHCGLTVAEIARVAVGPTVFEGDDAAVLWAVDHVLTNRRIDAATQRMLGEGGMLSVRIAAKFYDMVASVMHEAEPEPGATPIAGLETAAHARAAYVGYTP
jgi:carboxymuconolactone decarboxylase family protein